MVYGPPGAASFFETILPSGIGLVEIWIGPFGAGESGEGIMRR